MAKVISSSSNNGGISCTNNLNSALEIVKNKSAMKGLTTTTAGAGVELLAPSSYNNSANKNRGGNYGAAAAGTNPFPHSSQAYTTSQQLHH